MKKLSALLVLSGLISMAVAQTVTIGKQVWMTKNLTVTSFRNGNVIKEAKTNEEWQKANQSKQPAWCYYDNNAANGTKYGILYNWYAVNDSRGLAPVGWHIATDSEWTALAKFLKLDSAGIKMKTTTGWNNNGNGNNKSGFLGLPGGMRDPGGYFTEIGNGGYWWSYTGNNPNTEAVHRNLVFNSNNFYGYSSGAYFAIGMSVRCIRDY